MLLSSITGVCVVLTQEPQQVPASVIVLSWSCFSGGFVALSRFEQLLKISGLSIHLLLLVSHFIRDNLDQLLNLLTNLFTLSL